MGKKKEKEIEIEDVKFIYVNPICKDTENRPEVLSKLAEKHGATVIYDERVHPEWLLMAEEEITEEELEAMEKNNEAEM